MRRRDDEAHARQLDIWIDGLQSAFTDRILPVDLAISTRWGRLTSDRSRPTVDALIGATAATHDLCLVTRNAADFRDMGVEVLNPWISPP
jgi:predicted nucleic acid-binding protein